MAARPSTTGITQFDFSTADRTPGTGVVRQPTSADREAATIAGQRGRTTDAAGVQRRNNSAARIAGNKVAGATRVNGGQFKDGGSI